MVNHNIVFEVFGLFLPILAGLIWLIRLEGRINVHQALHDRLASDVAYIRSRIDKVLNGRYPHSDE
jgi:hypothetical protein